jgi:hypothetical protein
MLIRQQRTGGFSTPRARRRVPRRRPVHAACFRLESLEGRSLLSASGSSSLGTAQVQLEPAETLDQAQLLGDLTTEPQLGAVGTIGNGPDGAADVAWFSFTLDGPEHVQVDLAPRGNGHPLSGVLSLYNDDQFDFQDLYDPVGYRLLAQASGSANSGPQIGRDLGPGTYFVAVSGAGNTGFHPLLAGSGLPGASGAYQLTLGATPLDIDPSDGPSVLTSDPPAGAVLDASPFVIRLGFGSALDPTTIVPGQTVSLTYNPSGTFGDGSDQTVALAWTNVGAGGTELQLAPAAPLAPGYYQVFLAGDSSTEPAVVADVNGIPLGANAGQPLGQDFTETFQIDGIKGRTGPGAGSDDTPATAQDLGNITSAGLLQVAGAIGNDPYYDNSDPAHNPANDVDLYHFQISGPGRYALSAEVFAGRIGSPLDPGVSLYGVNAADGTLQFIAGNNNTNNPIQATDGSTPLFFDSFLSQGLTAGDYYLAVADGQNVPSPSEGQGDWSPGILDPNTTHGAGNGFTTGPYVLNVQVQAFTQAPQVVASTPSQGAILFQPPAQLTVQFDEPVNIEQQAYVGYLATFSCTVGSVYIEGSDGTQYFPRVDSYNPATNQVTLTMLDRLAPGSYALHLSGPAGLGDLAGDPLVGNDPSGDYILRFTVKGADLVQPVPSGQEGQIQAAPQRNGFQDLGVLFPHELQDGLILNYSLSQGSAAVATTSKGQTYQFTVLQDQSYTIALSGTGLPPGAHLALGAVTGHFVSVASHGEGMIWFGEFLPGTYTIKVQGTTPATPYRIRIAMSGSADNPVPLVSGAAPALQLHFGAIAPAVDGDGGQVSPPSSTGGPSDPTGTTGGSSSPGVGGASDPGSPPGGSSGATGGTSPNVPSSKPVAGSGSTAIISGPAPFGIGTGTVIVTSTPASSTGATPDPLLVTVIIPSGTLGTTQASPALAPMGGTVSEPLEAAVVSVASAAPGAVSQVENLVSGSLALLAVGPVGGVQATGTTASPGVQVAQVALPTQGNSPVPMGLVSLVTLTRSGELGDIPPPIEPAPQAVAGVAPQLETPEALAANPGRKSRPAEPGAEAVGRVVVQWNNRPVAAREAESAAAAAPAVDAERARAEGMKLADAGRPSQAATTAEGMGETAVESLASAHGPWLLLLAVVGTVAFYTRRRVARSRAAAHCGDVHPAAPPGLFRRWGLRLPNRAGRPHLKGPVTSGATPRSRCTAASRPRHLSNP